MNNPANHLKRVTEGVAQDALPAKELLERAASASSVEGVIAFNRVLTMNARTVAGVDGSRDVFVQSTTGNERNEMRNAIYHLSPGLAVPIYDDKIMELHTAMQRQSPSHHSLLLRARRFTVGDKNTTRDPTNASECYEEAVKLARRSDEKARVLTEHARFLLDLDEQAPNKSKRMQWQKQAIKLLEDSLSFHPLFSTQDELINIYTYCLATNLRNPLRANELEHMARSYSDPYFREEMSPFFGVGGDSDRRLISVSRDAVVKPRSCLLPVLGAPKRGKTTTLNSLRGLPFVSNYKSTELAEISQFVMEPDLCGVNDAMLGDLDFRENSFRAIASRLHRRDVVEDERNLMEDTSRVDIVAEKHRDVLQIVRGAGTRSEISCKKSQFVRCWDMGGQNEYEMAHSLFIGRADIVVFVVNLKRVWNAETREDEVNKLCYWMQLAHMMVRDPCKVRVIIVGTRKGEVDCEADARGLLFERIRLVVSESVDECWVRDTGEKAGCVFIGIENSGAIDNSVGSGLENLSEELKRYMKDVLAQREELPLKWLALIDKMRRIQGDKKVLWTRKEVANVCIIIKWHATCGDRAKSSRGHM